SLAPRGFRTTESSAMVTFSARREVLPGRTLSSGTTGEAAEHHKARLAAISCLKIYFRRPHNALLLLRKAEMGERTHRVDLGVSRSIDRSNLWLTLPNAPFCRGG